MIRLLDDEATQAGVVQMALHEETCVPCRDGGTALTANERRELLAELPGWEVINGHHLHRHLDFNDFKDALQWLNRAGAICEAQGHHGDFRVGWGYVDIDIYTHKADGLTRADGVLAAKFDALGT
jgi:4a-hydroxytetrahydrobiopterin dehydratase